MTLIGSSRRVDEAYVHQIRLDISQAAVKRNGDALRAAQVPLMNTVVSARDEDKLLGPRNIPTRKAAELQSRTLRTIKTRRRKREQAHSTTRPKLLSVPAVIY